VSGSDTDSGDGETANSTAIPTTTQDSTTTEDPSGIDASESSTGTDTNAEALGDGGCICNARAGHGGGLVALLFLLCARRRRTPVGRAKIVRALKPLPLAPSARHPR